jgi:hypothetical protein
MQMIEYARARTQWQFNWETKNVYYVYHCGKNGRRPSAEVLLVDGAKVVYATDAYSAPRDDSVADLSRCKT